MLDDVDAYYENIKAKGAKIAAAPQSMEWNTREMLVEDPDGHMIRFGHRIDCDWKQFPAYLGIWTDFFPKLSFA